MAKQSFKDLIFKFLKKDENLGAYGGVKQNPSKRFKVKFAMPNKPNNMAVAAYQFEKDAEKFKKDIIAKGGKAILTKEDAPANATGTAVAGTGDDSSTVVVKKKKELQKKLMKRMGITEAINRAIPDLEYPKDEIRERVNQLKQLALGEAAPDPTTYGPDKVAKAMAIAVKSDGQYSKAVRDIEKIAKNLSKVSTIARALKTANEDLDAQPQDKDVKKVKGTQPKKYYKKLDKDTKKKRAAFFKKKAGTYKKSDDDDDYKAAPGDKKAKTKPSIHTKKFKQMYGEGLLDLEEKIKGIENKAKKTGMPYGILKKVYDRGMAAWKGGHRPGATQQQWAFARVNSFVTKSSGTWGGADKDLAKKVRGSK